MEAQYEAILNAFKKYVQYCPACIVLHNLSIINNDGIEEEWIAATWKESQLQG